MRLDEGVPIEDLEVVEQDISTVPDFFIFELAQHMSRADIAKKFHTTEEEIDKIITRYIEVAARLNPVKEKIDMELREKYKNTSDNIG
jgi:tRNA(Ser,Leu) C12 N-acetylase TAN1